MENDHLVGSLFGQMESRDVFEVTGMLFFGTLGLVPQKAMLGIQSPGWAGKVHNFDKPFMQSFLMSFGMMFALPISKVWDADNRGSRLPRTLREKVLASLPCALDLVSSTLMKFGMFWIDVSVSLMLRGSMVIFLAVGSIKFQPRKLIPAEWFGIVIVVIALLIIGVSSILIPSEEGTLQSTIGQKVLGVLFVIASQVFQAAQIIIEENLMKEESMAALELVGWEGIWGFLMIIFVAFPFALIVPGSDPSPLGTSLENFMDSFLQFQTGAVVIWCVVWIVAVLGFNMFGMLVISHTSALNHSLIDAVRGLLVWITMLITTAAGAPFGEKWVAWSWLELGGFITLVSGILIYNKLWELPFFEYPPDGKTVMLQSRAE
jgi:hypothetical protein